MTKSLRVRVVTAKMTDVNYEPRFHVVLHSPEIPQNTGTIGRTCVALEAKLWLVRPLGFRMDEKSLRRAGLDYWQHLEWEIADHWQNLQQKLGDRRFWLFSRFANQDFRSVEYNSDDVLVFGSETSGLPTVLTTQYQDRLLRIPSSQWVRSINLSAAVAVAGFEIQRQLDA